MNKEQKESLGKPQEIGKRTYYDPEREAMEQRIRRELAVKHKAGESWRKRHTEEVLGILRDPETPQITKELVFEYVDAWEQLDQVQDELETNDKDIEKAENAGEPLLVVKYNQYKEILEENKSLRITRLAKDKRLLDASRLFPQGIELIPEKEYRDLGLGKVFAAPESRFSKRSTQALVKEAKEKEQEAEKKEEPGIA